MYLALCLRIGALVLASRSGRVWPRPEFGAAAGPALQSGKRARTDQSLEYQQCSRDVKSGGPGDTREYHVGEAAPRRACARSTGSIAPLSHSCHSRPLLAPCWALPSGAPSKTSTADGSRYSSRRSCTSEPPSARRKCRRCGVMEYRDVLADGSCRGRLLPVTYAFLAEIMLTKHGAGVSCSSAALVRSRGSARWPWFQLWELPRWGSPCWPDCRLHRPGNSPAVRKRPASSGFGVAITWPSAAPGVDVRGQCIQSPT